MVEKTITVQYAGIKLVVDGIQVTPKDANGAVVEPFVYNGTTYLPVRAVGSAIGQEVDWDGTTRTVYIGKIPGKAGENYLEPYEKSSVTVYSSDPTRSFSMMGKKYTQGIVMTYKDSYAYFNLDGKYDRVEFDIGHKDGGDTKSGSVYIYVDGEVVQEIEVTKDMQTKHVSIPVNYGLQMKIVSDSYGDYGLADLQAFE